MLVDYSTSRPSMAVLKSNHVTGVGRYIGWDSVPGYPSIGKNLTKAESETILQSGISIFLAFEYAADAATRGAAQGAEDGALATAQLKELGAPVGMAVYFAVDFNIPDYAPGLTDIPVNAMAKLGPVGEYFAAIRALRPAYEIGVYGGYYAVSRALNAGLATKAWQATAWSGGKLDPRVEIYQTTSTAPVPGGDVDVRENTNTNLDYGQWPRPEMPTPKPTPPKQIQEVDMAYILPLSDKLARVLPVPADSSKVTVYADSLTDKVIPPEIRIGFGPAWSLVQVKPTWDTPVVVTVPPGENRITVSRLDGGDVPVTFNFS